MSKQKEFSNVPLTEIVIHQDDSDDNNSNHDDKNNCHDNTINLLNTSDNIQSENRLKNIRESTLCNGVFICNLIWFLTLSGTVLWALSEAGVFGEGIIREKRFGESCGGSNRGFGGGRSCSIGLYCLNNTCQENERNITWLVEDCHDPPPPADCPPQTVEIQKIVSYYDYLEYPNMYLIPKQGETALDVVPEVDYGACKEICSRNSTCNAICYYASNRECHPRSSSGVTPPVATGGEFWTCAIKLFP